MLSHKFIAGPLNRHLVLSTTLFNRVVAGSQIPRQSTPQNSRKQLQSYPTMATLATTDLGDANEPLLATGDLRALQPIFNIYGSKRSFHGRIVTVKVFEDNVLVRQMLETKPEYGSGSVLVVDGGGSQRCALVGGNLAQIGYTNGWGGIVVNGYIRDVDEINACDIGVRALGTHPLKSKKRGAGETRLPVYMAGYVIHDGEWLYADGDGVLISKNPLDLA